MKCRGCKVRFYQSVTRCNRDKRGRNCDMVCTGCGDSLNARFDKAFGRK